MKNRFDPDIRWVEARLRSVPWADIQNQHIDFLLLHLNENFNDKGVSFERAVRGEIFYGEGKFREKNAWFTGIPTGEFFPDSDGSINDIVLKITKRTGRFDRCMPEVVWRVEELIAHELVHANQDRLARANGGSIGGPAHEDWYFRDSYEIDAMSVEIILQLSRIEPDKMRLIEMIKTGSKKLLKSDRYKVYVNQLKDDPIGFRTTYNRMIKKILQRLQ